MAEIKSVPAIRFNGFDNKWEECKLLDNIEKIIDFRGRTPKKLGLDWSEEGYLSLSALNVKNGYIDKNLDAHYGNQKLYDKWMSGNELHKNQVLFTTEAPMGNVAQIPDNQKYILSQRTIAFEIKTNLITENFLAVVLGSPGIFYKLSSLSSGGTAKGVSQKSLANLNLKISKDITEQTKIGSYFQNLDKLIALHQAKYDKLTNLKKAMLEKMFPKKGADVPEIRFREFEGAWKEKELNEICTYHTSSLSVGDAIADGKYELYDANSAIGYTNTNIQNCDYITIIKDGSGVGRVRMLPKNTSFIGTMGAFHPKDSNIFFLLCVLSKTDFSKHVTGATIPHVYFSSYGREKYRIPCLQEQQKIGLYFQNLDKLITLYQSKLDKLSNLKKACLEKMFV